MRLAKQNNTKKEKRLVKSKPHPRQRQFAPSIPPSLKKIIFAMSGVCIACPCLLKFVMFKHVLVLTQKLHSKEDMIPGWKTLPTLLNVDC